MLSPLMQAALPGQCRSSTHTAKLGFHRSLVRSGTADGFHRGGEVVEWLSGAGVTLFFAGSTYAAVKTSMVESWPRVTSKRISADVKAVAQGTFDFSRLEPLMPVPGQDVGEDE
jgi:hypothetical protein